MIGLLSAHSAFQCTLVISHSASAGDLVAAARIRVNLAADGAAQLVRDNPDLNTQRWEKFSRFRKFFSVPVSRNVFQPSEPFSFAAQLSNPERVQHLGTNPTKIQI